MAFKKNIKTKIALTAMTVLMAGSLCACGGGGGYMGPVEDWMSFVNKRNTDAIDLMTLFNPDFSSKELDNLIDLAIDYSGDEYEDYMEEMAEEIEDTYDDAEDEFEGWKISFEEKSADEIKSKDLKEYNEYIEDYYKDYLEDTVDDLEDALEEEDDIEEFADEMEISEKEAKKYIEAMIDYMKAYEEIEATEGYEVKGKFILKSDGDEYKTEYISFIVLKIDGSWVYWGLSDYDSLEFEDDDEDVFSFFFYELGSKSFINTDLLYY